MLSQLWPHDALYNVYKGALTIFRTTWICPRLLCSKFYMGFCSDRPYECVYKIWSPYSFAIPEIIGGFLKNWAVPSYADAFFSPKFLMGFCSNGPCKCTCQIFPYQKNTMVEPWLVEPCFWVWFYHMVNHGWTIPKNMVQPWYFFDRGSLALPILR